jgi:hypothetical protein
VLPVVELLKLYWLLLGKDFLTFTLCLVLSTAKADHVIRVRYRLRVFYPTATVGTLTAVTLVATHGRTDTGSTRAS